MNANVGYCLKCGATQGNHYSPECLPGFATTDPVKYYAVVMQQDYDALAAQMAEMRQAMDELHVKHGRSMRGIEQLEARLAEAEQRLRDICAVDKAAPGRKDCWIWADMLEIAVSYFPDREWRRPTVSAVVAPEPKP